MLRSLLTVFALAAIGSSQVLNISTNYPSQINDTSTRRSAFYLHVKANNPAYDGHNVQLRPTNNGTSSIVVVDKASPVLQAQLKNGTIYAQNRTWTNQIYDLGPTAYLANQSTIGNNFRQSFEFRNDSGAADGPYVNSRNGFYLTNLGNDGTYGLYHEVPIGWVNGFTICAHEDYYQLFYYEYLQSSTDVEGCESIGLQVSVYIPCPPS